MQSSFLYIPTTSCCAFPQSGANQLDYLYFVITLVCPKTMSCQWFKSSVSLNKGIKIINSLEDTKSEQFINRIVGKLKQQDSEIFTKEETIKLQKIFNISEENLVLSIKTVVYLLRRMLKFIFMPSPLKKDLTDIGFNEEKAVLFVKIWSKETSTALNEIGSGVTDLQSENINFTSKLNTELSSDIIKKCKVPKAYLSICDQNKVTDIEMEHTELYSMFLQFEAIQHELDNLI